MWKYSDLQRGISFERYLGFILPNITLVYGLEQFLYTLLSILWWVVLGYYTVCQNLIWDCVGVFQDCFLFEMWEIHTEIP